MNLALINFNKGPKECDRGYVKQLLTDAQTKIIAANDEEEKVLLPQIQHTLAFLEEADEYEFDADDDDQFGFVDPTTDGKTDLREFERLLMVELDRQIARRGKPGMTMANMSEKEFHRLVTPAVMREVCRNLSKETGLGIKAVEKLVDKLTEGMR